MVIFAAEKELVQDLLNNQIYPNKSSVLKDHLEVVSGHDKWNGKFDLLNSLSITQLQRILEEGN